MGGMKDLLGDTPYDLFTLERPAAKTIETAKAEKAAAMAQVDAAANPEWKANMRQCLIDVAKAKPFFTSDDVLEMAQARGQLSGTHDPRAFGPVIVAAAKNRICIKTDRMEKSRRRHASPITVWRSLIWSAP